MKKLGRHGLCNDTTYFICFSFGFSVLIRVFSIETPGHYFIFTLLDPTLVIDERSSSENRGYSISPECYVVLISNFGPRSDIEGVKDFPVTFLDSRNDESFFNYFFFSFYVHNLCTDRYNWYYILSPLFTQDKLCSLIFVLSSFSIRFLSSSSLLFLFSSLIILSFVTMFSSFGFMKNFD